jgi:protein arginine N-methyltransferase 1
MSNLKDFSSPKSAMKDFISSKSKTKEDELDYYFDSYSYMDIHQEMLSDYVRTEAYRDSMIRNKELFKGKVVMDIGCGTGILSMFAAKSGAKHVYAIEMADVYKVAQEIVNRNGFGNKITILHGKVEEVKLPVEKVDIIVSEWMGYLLLFEGMFDSVLWARDKYLAPGGMLFPDRAVIKLAGLDDLKYNSDKRVLYRNRFNCNLSRMNEFVLLEPLVDTCNSDAILTDECVVADIDLMTCNLKDLDFVAGYKLNVHTKGFISGVVCWFDVFFSYGKNPVVLSTSPFEESTHWKQGILYYETDLPVEKEDSVSGSVIFSKCKVNFRDLDIKLSYKIKNKHLTLDKTQFYIFK